MRHAPTQTSLNIDARLKVWMTQYQNGEVSAFDALYQALAPRIYGYLNSKMGKSNETDDVFQRVFAKLHQSRGLYESKFEVMPWVFAICRTVLIDHARENNVHCNHREDIELESIPAVENHSDKAGEFASALGHLSQREQVALSARYIDELAFAEIAEKLSLSESNVRKIISRAIQRLRFEGGLRK